MKILIIINLFLFPFFLNAQKIHFYFSPGMTYIKTYETKVLNSLLPLGPKFGYKTGIGLKYKIYKSFESVIELGYSNGGGRKRKFIIDNNGNISFQNAGFINTNQIYSNFLVNYCIPKGWNLNFGIQINYEFNPYWENQNRITYKLLPSTRFGVGYRLFKFLYFEPFYLNFIKPYVISYPNQPNKHFYRIYGANINYLF